MCVYFTQRGKNRYDKIIRPKICRGDPMWSPRKKFTPIQISGDRKGRPYAINFFMHQKIRFLSWRTARDTQAKYIPEFYMSR